MDKNEENPTKTQTLGIVRPSELEPQLKALGGSNSDEFNNRLANQVCESCWFGARDEKEKDEIRTAAVHALIGIEPKDELEGMLAVQMIACHNASMECQRRAMLPDMAFEMRQENLKQAAKLSRTYAQLVATLDKHRGKGQQKVTVEHVHVHEGGQAIVGNVRQGDGGAKKPKEQPHAETITYAPEPEMRSDMQTEREPLPITGNEEW